MAIPRMPSTITGSTLPLPWGRGGFALVVTMTMMSLVVVLCLALLSLALGVRSGAASQRDQLEARSKARLALSLAIGQLQVQMGPDQRISTAADQIAGESPETSGASPNRRRWTGVYDAWLAKEKTRPTPNFRRWMVSGDEKVLSQIETAKSSGAVGKTLPGRPAEIRLVPSMGGAGSEASGEVKVPLVGAGENGAVAWWTGDENLKALLLERNEKRDESVEGVRARVAAAPRQAIELAESAAGVKPFKSLQPGDARAAKLVDWGETAFVAEPAEAATPLFHDLTTYSTGMVTNVRSGGFRRDLSMYLEKPYDQRPTDVFYTINGEPGINMEELWCYYNIWKPGGKGLVTGGLSAYTTGGSVPGNAPYLAVPNTSIQQDEFFYFKQPNLVSVQAAFSMDAVAEAANPALYDLRLVVDPILTFWNPLDVPVTIRSFNTVKYWQLPYDVKLTITSKATPITVPLSRLINAGDRNVISVRAGLAQPITLRPGEVLMVSQAARTPTAEFSGDIHKIDTVAGFNFGGGIAFKMKDTSNALVTILPTDTVKYEMYPNDQTSGGPNGGSHSSYFSLTHHEWYIGEDRDPAGVGTGDVSFGFGNLAVDWGFGNARVRADQFRHTSEVATKPSAERLIATGFPQVFKGIGPNDGRPLSAAQLLGHKEPFFLYSYNLKTENGAQRRGRYLAHFNRNCFHQDFYDLSEAEMQAVPYELQMEPLDSWKSPNIELSPNGNGFFGGGRTAYDGVNQIVTHSIPRAPVVSLGALQNSLANGFSFMRPKYEYATLNAREPLLPQISHAIGNSNASALIDPSQTQGSLKGGRPVADHSYLANQALFDDWFFSGVAPQTSALFTEKRSQSQVARDFLENGRALPNAHYRARLGKEDAATVLKLLFQGENPTPAAADRLASYLSVEGMFNVNSTSVQAWKAMLGGLKGQMFVIQEINGGEGIGEKRGDTHVTSLLTPIGQIADIKGLDDVKTASQWYGYRTLTDDDITSLARAIVKEVRKRGPFLSLADFVNRRVGRDAELARCGAIEAALESKDVAINEPYLEGTRRAPSASSLTFPDAEAGPAAFGIPGCVKQGDILTPLAPVLSARSDTFRVRAYGEKTAPGGRIVSRAWCEAVVERTADYVDPSDEAYERDSQLGKPNQTFGRRFRIVSFRWLSPEEV